MATTRLGVGGYPAPGGEPPRFASIIQTIPDFSQVVHFAVRLRISFTQTIPAFTQSFVLKAPVKLTVNQTIPDFSQNLSFAHRLFLEFDQTIPDFHQVLVFGPNHLRFNQTIPAFQQRHIYNTHSLTAAAGGGGGGAAGRYGLGEDGQGGREDGVGGYGGAADNNLTPRQTTSGSTGNTGTEWDGTYGSGSGGSGGDWGDVLHGSNGGVGGQYGGGGGGGGAGLLGGGLGALGGEGAIFIQYDPGTGPVTIILTHDTPGSSFVFPEDWNTESNIVLLVGAGGCGHDGTLTVGGDGGGGGGAVGIINATIYSPGEVIDFHIPTAAEVCAGTDIPETVLGDHQAAPGINGDGSGGGTSIPYDPIDGETVINNVPGNGGPGGDLGIAVGVRRTHVLIVAG